MPNILYHAFTGREYKKGNEKKTYWTRIGTVFAHNTGKGMDLVLDALPIDGRITFFEPREKIETAPETAPEA